MSSLADSRIVVNRVRGRADRLQQYTVARIDAKSMRITHVSDLAEARRTRDEWLRGDFTFDPGQKRYFA